MAEFDRHGLMVTFIRSPRHENGALGCFRGHVAALEAAMASEEEFALILEDDVKLVPHFVAYVDQIRKNLHDQTTFDLIHLGGMTMFATSSPLLNLNQCRHLLTPAYLIRREFLRIELPKLRMIAQTEAYFTNRPWPLQIGVYFDRAYHVTQFATRVPLVTQRVSRSDNLWSTWCPRLSSSLSTTFCWPCIQGSQVVAYLTYCWVRMLVSFPKELYSIHT